MNSVQTAAERTLVERRLRSTPKLASYALSSRSLKTSRSAWDVGRAPTERALERGAFCGSRSPPEAVGGTGRKGHRGAGGTASAPERNQAE